MLEPKSFIAGNWVAPGSAATPIENPVTGKLQAMAGSPLPDAAAMIAYATKVGGPALRELGFHDRAKRLKALANYLNGRKEELYALSPFTGATRKDSWIDIDGGIGTIFVFASKGRREMPDGHIYLDGSVEQLSRNGTFLGQHIAVPLEGVAVQINAFNFPVWGMLEKLAPAFLAGVPVIVKPATVTSYLAEAAFAMIVESGILPEGAVQLIVGPVGDLLDHLGAQDVVSFTGSEATAAQLKGGRLIRSGTRFIAELDSLNATILGHDVRPGSETFEIFLNEAVTEITTKAGQKCTAIRRLIVPRSQAKNVGDALAARLREIRPGDPANPETKMGALVSPSQRREVLKVTEGIASEATCLLAADASGAALLSPALFLADDADTADLVHRTEAFGPVATILSARDMDHAAQIANRGGGSLVVSVFTDDPAEAALTACKLAPWHGRIYLMGQQAASEATGHGSPLPHMTHGGPGRAGGGEELGGVRGVLHYMARVAVQGAPEMLTAISGQWVEGAAEKTARSHPFRKNFNAIEIGDTLHTEDREVTLSDIETFAEFTGDRFYAHMDEEAARANPFFPGRVAHGYLLLSFAAGLFVDPDPGPVLANTGLNNLSFQKPVSPGDRIRARLVAKRKTRRTETYGEIAWAVTLNNQDGDQVAEYELLTMVAYAWPGPA